MSDVVANSIDLSHEHPLVLFKDLDVENDGNKEAHVCSRCEKPVLQGPGYKCSECNFLLHKSCNELPLELHHHPLHPNHTLILVAPSKSHFCDACAEDCTRRFFYRCQQCNFDLDINCVSRWRNSIDECHQHEFFPIFPGLNQIQFICEACGKESKDGAIAYLCSRCRFLVHWKCARYPRNISTTVHKHSLTLTCSLHQMVEEKDDIFCKLCLRKVKTEYGVYYCQDCRYAAHLQCAKRCEGEYMDMDSVPSEIEHFSLHEHKLMMSKKEVEVEDDDRICEGCMFSISDPPFYSCEPCNYFLHATCSILPSKKQLPLLHEHPLTLLSQPPNSPSGIFRCYACDRFQHGFCYKCDSCNYLKMDTQCSSLLEILNHEGHEHSLRIALNRDKIRCKGCYGYSPSVLFVCSECDEFGLCYRCATLPYKVRYEYDIHDFLTLTYSVEDDSGEYYCFICEEIRDTRKWFYYCKKCDFAAHPDCVIGKYSRIKFGRTFTSHEYHEHPLTIVQKNKYSPPCDFCEDTFDGLAVACTQCKFSFHLRGLDWNRERICRKK